MSVSNTVNIAYEKLVLPPFAIEFALGSQGHEILKADQPNRGCVSDYCNQVQVFLFSFE